MQKPKIKKNFGLSGMRILDGSHWHYPAHAYLYSGGLEGSLEDGLEKPELSEDWSTMRLYAVVEGFWPVLTRSLNEIGVT